MPKGKKYGGKNWAKGQSGNPNGRPRNPPEVLALARLTREQFTAIMGGFMALPLEGIAERLKTPGIPALEHWIGQTVLKGIEEGDLSQLEKMADRVYGKVKETVEVSVPKPTYIDRLDGSFVELGTTLEAEVVDPPEER